MVGRSPLGETAHPVQELTQAQICPIDMRTKRIGNCRQLPLPRPGQFPASEDVVEPGK
jgi:hypothetical protein